MAQYVTDVASAGDSRTLTKKELERVRELAGTIARNPGGPYTIRRLACDTGLAPNKLQQVSDIYMDGPWRTISGTGG